MIDSKGNVPIFKERNDIVQVFERGPPVETMTGFLVFAIFSIRTQSFKSELAILIIGIPRFEQRSTDRSSKGSP